jgi:hypothetical protein
MPTSSLALFITAPSHLWIVHNQRVFLTQGEDVIAGIETQEDLIFMKKQHARGVCWASDFIQRYICAHAYAICFL